MSVRVIAQVLPSESQADLIQRLRCTQGHLRSLVKLVEAGQPYELILHQLDAVQAALKVIENKTIEHLVRQNTSILPALPCEQDRREAVEEITDLFQRLQRNASTEQELDP